MELHAFCQNLYDLFKVGRFLPIVDEFHAFSRDLEGSMHFGGEQLCSECFGSVLELFLHVVEIVRLCQDSGELHACFENLCGLFNFGRFLPVVDELHALF